MKAIKSAAALAAAITILLTGCGQGNDSSERERETASESSSSVSSHEESSSTAESTQAESNSAAQSSQAESSSTAESTQADSSEKATTTGQTSSASSAAPSTTAAATTTTAAAAAPHDESGTANKSANYAAVPTSGSWVNGVFVCDRNKGDRIRGLIGFYGSESCGQKFAAMVNDVKKAVGDKVNVYTLGAPVSSAFYTPKGVTGVTTDQHKAILDLSKTLDKSIKNIDTYAALSSHTDEYIYYRTDHHWTTLAAYYAVKEFAKAANVPYAPLSSYEKCVKTGFTGSMYTYSNYPEFKTYPDTYTYYKPKNKYTTTYYNGAFQNGTASQLFLDSAVGSNSYCTILGSDLNLAEIKTDVKNGRTLVLIKDSYGNALTPYFVGSFEKIYVLDMRYTTVNLRSFFKKVGATDILFGSSLSSFYTPSRVDGIRAIL